MKIFYSRYPHIFISIRCDPFHPYGKTLSPAFTIKLNLHELFQLFQLLFSDVGWPEVFQSLNNDMILLMSGSESPIWQDPSDALLAAWLGETSLKFIFHLDNMSHKDIF